MKTGKHKEFVKLIRQAVWFILIAGSINLVLGFAAGRIFFSQQTGKFARLTHTIYSDSSQILIMGSSHANRHYIPGLIAARLNKTCYNAGVQGQGILFQLALQKIIFSRQLPELVVLNVDKNWLYENQGMYERLSDLYPYYWEFREELYPILRHNNPLIDLQMLSEAYRTNSTLVHAIRYMIAPQRDEAGYRPLFGRMKISDAKDAEKKTHRPGKEKALDPFFTESLRQMISISCNKDVKLILVVSPSVAGNDPGTGNRSCEMIRLLASENSVALLDFSNDARFVGRPELFNDPGHLNDEGARLFSAAIADTLDVILTGSRQGR